MKVLSGQELTIARSWMAHAEKIAREATCERSKCGSIIVSNGVLIGEGFNSPPGDLSSQIRCDLSKDSYDMKVTDKTCCVHAEQRAIMDALRRAPNNIIGSRLYFIRLGEDGEKSFAGPPYCTICSKMALDVGISEFTLWHEKGITAYDTREYNDLSFNFRR